MDDEKQISDVDCGVLATRSTVPSDLGVIPSVSYPDGHAKVGHPAVGTKVITRRLAVSSP